MIIGYISSFSIAIVLSIFYLGCLVSDFSGYINAKLGKDDKRIELNFFEKEKESSQIFNFSDSYIVTEEPTANVQLSFVYFTYFDNPPCSKYIADIKFFQFSRPPPSC